MVTILSCVITVVFFITKVRGTVLVTPRNSGNKGERKDEGISQFPKAKSVVNF